MLSLMTKRIQVVLWIISVLIMMVNAAKNVKAGTLLDEQFSTDVFSSGSWSRTDTSVSVDVANGWLRIGSNGVVDDGADWYGSFPLPLVIEWRERTYTGDPGTGPYFSLPKLELYWGPTYNDHFTITYVDIDNTGLGGWLLYGWTNILTLGPTNWNQWRTVKAIIRSDGDELFAKEDGDLDFTPIVSTTWTKPDHLVRFRLCQHTDDVSDFDYVVVKNLPPPTGATCGTVTHQNGNPVANVTVKVIDSDNNQVGAPIVTGSDGTFHFDSLLVGSYSVMMVTPLGYSVSPGETQTGIQVTGYPCTEVNFVLTPTIISNTCRTIGYWKHQFDVYLSGKGHAEEGSDDLEEYLDLVHLHFNALGIYIDLEDFDFQDAKNVLTVQGGKLMEDRAKQQLFALLLNFASGRIGNETVVSEDNRVAAEAITYVASLIKDGNPANDELAKSICDLINNSQMVETGIIPESPKRYRIGEAVTTPTEYALEQNYPNPFNPECQIAYLLPADCYVILTVYNVLGQKVNVLVDENENAGNKSVKWDGKDDNGNDVSSGIYFYRLQAGEFAQTRKMVLLR